MRVLIVGPFKNRDYDEYRPELQAATDDIKRIFKDAKVCSILRMASDLDYLVENVNQLPTINAVYFTSGWEKDETCCLIDQICALYRIQRIEPKS